jgi:diketogulonate reductase-like aldo/keto reductase
MISSGNIRIHPRVGLDTMEKQISIPTRAHRSLPSVGLGFWKIPNDSTAKLALEAAKIGYRHFDCASDYGNEQQVGEGINQILSEGICRREDLWVTGKLWNTYHRKEHVRLACERSLPYLFAKLGKPWKGWFKPAWYAPWG